MTNVDVYLYVLGPAAALTFGLFVWISARFFPPPNDEIDRIEKVTQGGVDGLRKAKR